MSGVEFTPWPKIARLNREIIITEKINGTNAAVKIVDADTVDSVYYTWEDGLDTPHYPENRVADVEITDPRVGSKIYLVFAQSRTRLITPAQDNFGFAKWVQDNSQRLVEVLGVGTHFGEWWGSGIQNSYGLPKGERRFSLFNTSRWTPADVEDAVPGLRVVPVLYQGPFNEFRILLALEELRSNGSVACAGFMDPEGIVIFHTASNEMYKVTLKGDDAPKGPEAHARDEEISGHEGVVGHSMQVVRYPNPKTANRDSLDGIGLKGGAPQ